MHALQPLLNCQVGRYHEAPCRRAAPRRRRAGDMPDALVQGPRVAAAGVAVAGLAGQRVPGRRGRGGRRGPARGARRPARGGRRREGWRGRSTGPLGIGEPIGWRLAKVGGRGVPRFRGLDLLEGFAVERRRGGAGIGHPGLVGPRSDRRLPRRSGPLHSCLRVESAPSSGWTYCFLCDRQQFAQPLQRCCAPRVGNSLITHPPLHHVDGPESNIGPLYHRELPDLWRSWPCHRRRVGCGALQRSVEAFAGCGRASGCVPGQQHDLR
mmetsp:Transcript_124931/g.400196  ORF Transcript_124931/g.400196 Transcript_124931/m.400196 type:complete len:267 (+) Transcript_124931:471-1271(+)